MEHMLEIIECISTGVLVTFIVAEILSVITQEVFHFIMRTILAGLAFVITISILIIEIYLGINCVNTIIMLLIWIVLFLCSLIILLIDLAIGYIGLLIEYIDEDDEEDDEEDSDNQKD